MDKTVKKIKRRNQLNAGIRYALLILVGFIMLYPLIWLFGASFKSNAEIFTSIGIIPSKFDFSSYIEGWKTSTEYTFTRYFMNTFLIVIPKVVATVISCTLTAYGFARFNFAGKKVFFSILIATLLLPQIVLRIPQFLLFKELRWLDTYYPLVAPSAFAVDTFFVFMLIQFIRGIPRELEEAAYIDGCNSLQTLIYVIVPVLKPALVSVALFQFMWSMNDFMGPLIYISSVEKYPVSLALKMSMDASSSIKWSQVIAISLVSLTPSLILYFSSQKYFIEGITSGGVKG
jgi:oligogalacturonide transport system permease protein